MSPAGPGRGFGFLDLEHAIVVRAPQLHLLRLTRCGVSRPTATNWLNALAEHGLLEDMKTGRDRLFINREFLELLVRPEPAA